LFIGSGRGRAPAIGPLGGGHTWLSRGLRKRRGMGSGERLRNSLRLYYGKKPEGGGKNDGLESSRQGNFRGGLRGMFLRRLGLRESMPNGYF